MKRYLLLVFVCVLAYGPAFAQIPVTGKVCELSTHITLPGVKVLNTNTHDNTQTNNAGIFMIKAKAGDILILTAFAYTPDTVVVVSARYMEIFMKPLNTQLKQVEIKNTTTSKNLGTLRDTNFHNQPLRYQTDANGNPIGGIALKFSYGKSAKEKHDEKFTYDVEATNAIDKAFSIINVGKYIPLKGTDLKDFVTLYRPTIAQYKAPDFDLTAYINVCYKRFITLPADQRKLAVLQADTVIKH